MPRLTRQPLPTIQPLPPNTAAPRAAEPLPDIVRVRIETGEGPIVVALDAQAGAGHHRQFRPLCRRGPVRRHQFLPRGRTKGASDRGFIQGGIRRNYKRMLAPIAHEPTSKTGLRHEPGTISMARSETGAGAMGDFFITVSAQPAMDAKAGEQGYAAFGRVVEGMDVVRRIHAAPTLPNAGRGAMRGQMIAEPVRS